MRGRRRWPGSRRTAQADRLMADGTSINARSGLTFAADVLGPIDGPLVLLLHGFPESRHSWRSALPSLAAAGYRAVAPDQRGYSADARPDPADLSNYAFDKLVNDAIEVVAAAHPQRLASLTIMSRPHPKSFQRALAKEDGDQKNRSKHHRAFLDADTGGMLLEDNARRLRTGLFGQGVPAAAMDEHLSVLGNPAAMEAALAWYRANKGLAADIGTIDVPTLYIWGDADATVGPDAAHGTAEFVSAAFAMEVLPGVGHFIMDQVPAKATELLLAHLKKHPV